MTFLTTSQQRALLLLAILGSLLVVALGPFATGLIGIPVMYVLLQPVHVRLVPRVGVRISAGLVVALAVSLVVFPALVFATLVVAEAQQIAGSLARSPQLERLANVTVIGIAVGPALADIGGSALRWLGGSALGLIGTATRQVLNLVIAMFGLYYLLLRPAEAWAAFSAYLPFPPETTERLRLRFGNVTTSMVIGTGVTAMLQGLFVGLGFWLTGLPNAVFWSLVTVVLSVLPVVGSGLVWGAAVVALLLDQRAVAGIAMGLWGLLVIGNVDFVVRPLVARRRAQVHPLTTLVGALAGVRLFGILGLLIGPLALSYFFELVNLYREEYGPAKPA